MSCWKKYGEPTMWNEQIKIAVNAIENLYESYVTGGELHIVVDDWNLSDDDLEWCFQNKTRLWDRVHNECYLAFKNLTEQQRASAMAHFGDICKEGLKAI